MKLLYKIWKPLLSAFGWTIIIMIHPWLAYSHTDQHTILAFAVGAVFLSLAVALLHLFEDEEEKQ